ncbi:MAG: hypothetical protein ACI9T8_000382 [Candidatus Saccharimonadales bacterium]|jgi:hypothetical protein
MLMVMRLVVIYRVRSDRARAVSEFIETLNRRYPGKTLHELDIDTREGAAEAALYGVMDYPAFIATAYDGRVVSMWQGMPLPLIDEVAAMLLDQQTVTV